MKLILDEWIVREVIDTLYMARTTLLGITGLDSPQDVEKKSANETAITRRISKAIDIIQQSDEQQHAPEGLEEAAEEWAENEAYGKPDAEFEMAYKGFKAGAKWGEKNTYNAIMKKADEVRDKRFNTDYEVKIEPAAGFDFGCVNVYHEGKLVGQYVEPKEEKKLPEGVDEAAHHIAIETLNDTRFMTTTMGHALGKLQDIFIAGAEWQSKKAQETIETAEDHAFLAGSNWQKEQMMKEGLKGEVCGRVKDHINVRFPDGLCKYLKPENISHIPADVKKYKVGDKVRVIIVKEEEA